MGDWLPHANTHRPKQGFVLPMNDWLLGAMRTEVEAGIAALAAGQYFDSDALHSLWRAFVQRPQAVGWARPWGLFVLGRYLNKHGLL
jgi:hypothetical protein